MRNRRASNPFSAWLLWACLLACWCTFPAHAAWIPEQWPTLAAPVGHDDFYIPPTLLPDGDPGDVIRYRRIPTTQLLNITSKGAATWQLMYLSINATGNPIAVTGTVLIPHGRDPATMPIVGFGMGTKGIADHCAPSLLAARVDYDHIYINTAIQKGWALAISDYEGLGTPGDHAYVVGQSLGRSVIDSVRAAQRLPETGLQADAKVAFWGYSEGGNATAWAAELQSDYAPEINLVGVASGGVPADLESLARSNDGSVAYATLVLASIGLNAAYPELQLDSYLNERGRAVAESVRNRCIFSAVPLYAFQRMARYLNDIDPVTTPLWQARMRENRLGQQPPQVPMYLYHGNLDQAVNYPQAKALRNTYCRAGVQLQWGVFLGEHVTTYAFAQTDAVRFLSRRFAGRDTPNSCTWLRRIGAIPAA